jgi:formate dehydrogenase gamma subunit
MALAHTAEWPAEAPSPEWYVRFNVWQRAQHWLLVISFAGLLLTGLPQKYPDVAAASWVIDLLGSISTARFLHRIFATIFVAESVLHMSEVGLSILRRRFRPSMVISPQDFRDAFNMLRYSVGLIPERPQFDRYDYKQKFEYWGIVFGAVIMIATGLMLWYPAYVTRVLPGEFIPAAKEMHSGEALLALAVVVLWHFYDVVLSPALLPMDTAMITGKISRERLMHEHTKEYWRLIGLGTRPGGPAASEDAVSAPRPPPRGPPAAGV